MSDLEKRFKVDGVMYFAEQPRKLLEWYAALFLTDIKHVEAINFSYLNVNGYLIEVHLADGKNTAGKNGQVIYWQVPVFDSFVERAVGIGASIYRGPIEIEVESNQGGNQKMAQLLDPSGNLIGIRN